MVWDWTGKVKGVDISSLQSRGEIPEHLNLPQYNTFRDSGHDRAFSGVKAQITRERVSPW